MEMRASETSSARNGPWRVELGITVGSGAEFPKGAQPREGRGAYSFPPSYGSNSKRDPPAVPAGTPIYWEDGTSAGNVGRSSEWVHPDAIDVGDLKCQEVLPKAKICFKRAAVRPLSEINKRP
jgi:hypothetical protein